MPGNPEQCRLNAARYLELSKRAKNRARRANLAALGKMWTKLAAELDPNTRYFAYFPNSSSTNLITQCQRL